MARFVRVDVSREVLEWALDRSGKRAQLEKKLPMLGKWLKGEEKPTVKQLEGFARQTHVPLGVLFLKNPPEEELPIADYRTFDDNLVREPSRNLMDTVYAMQRRQAWLRDYLIEEGYEPKSFVGSATPSDNVADIAASIRRTLGLSDDWAHSLRTWEEALTRLFQKAEQIGIMVVRNGIVGNSTTRKLDVTEFRGFVLVFEYAPVVFLNSNNSKAAQMFTFAHELAHIWLGRSGVFDLAYLQPAEEGIENTCNRIAAEFLVPIDRLRDHLSMRMQQVGHRVAFHDMAREFKVSPLVIARRALDLKLTSYAEYRAFYRDYLERLRRWEERTDDEDSNDGPRFYEVQRLRVGRLFIRYVVSALKEGKLLYREAYNLTGLYGDTFAEYAARETGGVLQ